LIDRIMNEAERLINARLADLIADHERVMQVA
jgi:hypothetical protein